MGFVTEMNELMTEYVAQANATSVYIIAHDNDHDNHSDSHDNSPNTHPNYHNNTHDNSNSGSWD